MYVHFRRAARCWAPAGAFIAVPAGTTAQVVFEEIILPWRTSQFEDGPTAATNKKSQPDGTGDQKA